MKRIRSPLLWAFALSGALATAGVLASNAAPQELAPVAVDDSATVIEDDPATRIDVLANDTGPEGEPMAVEFVDTTGTNGVVTITNSGADLTYRPNPDYCNDPDPVPEIPAPDDTFTYTLNGGSTATVSVQVSCVDDHPIAVDDSATITEDAPATAIEVMGNDTDVDAGPRTVSSVDTAGTDGRVEITDSGAGLTYTPSQDYCNDAASGPGAGPDDRFGYSLNGGSTATVSVTVSCVPDQPRAVDDSSSVSEDSGFTAIDVLANDIDPEGDPMQVHSVNVAGTNGQVKIARAGSGVRYQPDPDYCNDPDPVPEIPAPDDTFTYTLNGGSTATVSVMVGCREG